MEAGDVVDQGQLGELLLEVAALVAVFDPGDEFPERFEAPPETLVGFLEPRILTAHKFKSLPDHRVGNRPCEMWHPGEHD